MNELIKALRKYYNLTQMQFAEKIGVSFATVNRWENGHCVPKSKHMINHLCEYWIENAKGPNCSPGLTITKPIDIDVIESALIKCGASYKSSTKSQVLATKIYNLERISVVRLCIIGQMAAIKNDSVFAKSYILDSMCLEARILYTTLHPDMAYDYKHILNK